MRPAWLICAAAAAVLAVLAGWLAWGTRENYRWEAAKLFAGIHEEQR
jgi:hypothetical protein